MADAEQPATADAPPAPPAPTAAADDGDQTRAKFRAALDRKAERTAQGEDHRSGHGLVPHRNAKTQRQFRRKSG